MEDTRTFEELLISLIGGAEETDSFRSTRTSRGLKHVLYFARNIGDVMNLNLKDDDFRRIVGTFYTDMINSVMGEEYVDQGPTITKLMLMEANINGYTQGLKDSSREEQKPFGPCDLCRFNPPSSADGKPCTMCPAEKGGE